jgi:hypothetical protein
MLWFHAFPSKTILKTDTCPTYCLLTKDGAFVVLTKDNVCRTNVIRPKDVGAML